MAFDPSALDFLIVPGRGNSRPQHWQSHWLKELPNSSRVLQSNWAQPAPAEWVAKVGAAVRAAARPVALIAHSLATATVVKWAETASEGETAKVAAAFLVAPTDVENPDPSFDLVRAFAPLPHARLPFPALVVASRNDPRVSFSRAQEFAEAWGADLADVGELGHIGNDAHLGVWAAGLLLLGQLLAKRSP
jgi:predicted alpha/beta hydrolase family esterase